MQEKSVRSSTSLPYLFLASIAALFLEMTLIRWISTEVRVFAYVQNLALIACFLGFGLGCYHAGKKINYWIGTVSTLLLVVFVAIPGRPWHEFLMIVSELLTLSPDSAMWAFVGQTANLGMYIALAVAIVSAMLLLLIGAMFPLGQYVGKALDNASAPVPAYSVNLAGSLVGGWLLAGLSFLWTEPHLWFLISFALIILLLPQARRFVVPVLVALAVIVPLRWHRTDNDGLIWSPYQKLSLFKVSETDFHVNVNNTGYMRLTHAAPGVDLSSSSYDSPFKFVPGREKVLVVGSGGGNDVAAALRNGAQHVDAVEIDPGILYFGRRYHPDHPYASEKVSVYVNDARNFMRNSNERYDAIIFGLLDSHTVVSGTTNMRLDNYVYTQESFREAMRLLKPDGVLILKFEVRNPWLWMGNRFDAMFTDLGGRPPVIYYASSVGNFLSASVFMTSKSAGLWERASTPELARFLQAHPTVFQRGAETNVVPTRDDWPYVYHRSKSIPRTYLTIMVILLVLAAVLFGSKIKARRPGTMHFLFLGAGFLCMETQLVSRSALYFGNTWMVNCFVISAVLIVLVAANIFVERVAKIRAQVFFAILLISLIVNYVVPWSSLPLGTVQTGLLLYVAYAIPLFCAGVIFTDSFRKCQHRSSALGANLFGATVGGVSQNLSFIFGLKALLIVSAVFYGGAWLFGRSSQSEEPVASTELVMAAVAE